MIRALDDRAEHGEAGAREWLRRALLVLWLPLMLAALAAPVAGPLIIEKQHLVQNPFEQVGLLGTTPLKPFAREAIASGFRADDRIVAVDGHALSGGGTTDPNEELAGLLAGPDGTSVVISTRTADGTTRQHRLTRSAAHIGELAASAGLSLRALDWIGYLTGFFAASALVAAAALLFVKGGGRPVTLLLAFALPLLGMSYFGVPFLIATGMMAFRQAIQILAWSGVVLTLMLFPNGRFYPRWIRWLALANVLLTPVGMSGIVPQQPWILFHTTLLLAAGASFIYRYRTLSPGVERQQVRWALLGFAWAVIFLLLDVLLEFVVLPFASSARTVALGSVLGGLLVTLIGLTLAAGLLISLLRYRLYDAEKVIARSVSLGALGLVLVALFAGTEKIIELLGEEMFGERLGVLAGGIGAALAALTIVPLHHRLTHWAEHRFQKQLIQLRRGLPVLVGDLRETAPVERIAAASLDWVVRGVRASQAALVLGNRLAGARGIEAAEVESWRKGWLPSPEPGLDSARDDRLFPLRVPLEADGHGRVGWLLLGPRPDGSFYGKEERKTLEEIADPVARALEIAEVRETREVADRERWRGQEALNAELMRVLGALDEKLGRLVSKEGKAKA